MLNLMAAPMSNFCGTKKIFTTTIFTLLVAVGLLMAPGIALADPSDDVSARPRPDYDAIGLPLGGFRVYPTVRVGAVYDDNIYTQIVKTGDEFFTVAPAVRIQSNWSRHALNFRANSISSIYASNSSEDKTDFTIGADGRIDVQRGSNFRLRVNEQMLHEARQSPDTPLFAAQPTKYNLLTAGGAYYHQFNRLSLELGADMRRFDFDPTLRILTTPLDNSDRNRTLYESYLKASYAFSPGYSIYVRSSYGERQYDQFFDRGGLHRDSSQYDIDAGLSLELGHLLVGDISIGYLNHQYSGPLTDIKGLNFAADLTWYATELTTVRLNASRTINDTTIIGASGSDDKTVSLTVDHELLRNLLVRGRVGYTNSEYPGAARKDEYFNANFSAEYLLNRYMSATVGYAFDNRDTTIPAQGYEDNQISIGLKFQL